MGLFSNTHPIGYGFSPIPSSNLFLELCFIYNLLIDFTTVFPDYYSTISLPTSSQKRLAWDHSGSLYLNVNRACMFVLEFFYYAYGPMFSSYLRVKAEDERDVKTSLFETTELGREY